MVHKRPFVEEDTFEVSNKQSRQAEHNDHVVLSSEPFFPEDATLISNASGTELLSCNDLHASQLDCNLVVLL